MEFDEIIEKLSMTFMEKLTEKGAVEKLFLDIPRVVAKMQWAYYDQLIKSGFNEEQAQMLLYDVNEVIKSNARRD